MPIFDGLKLRSASAARAFPNDGELWLVVPDLVKSELRIIQLANEAIASARAHARPTPCR